MEIGIFVKYLIGINIFCILYCINSGIDIANELRLTLGFNSLLFSTYVVNDNVTTPIIPFSKVVYSMIVMISSIICIRSGHIYVVLVTIIVYNILSNKIDNITDVIKSVTDDIVLKQSNRTIRAIIIFILFVILTLITI